MAKASLIGAPPIHRRREDKLNAAPKNPREMLPMKKLQPDDILAQVEPTKSSVISAPFLAILAAAVAAVSPPPAVPPPS